MQFQDLIKEYRKKNKLTQEQLAEELKISSATVQNWESGRTNPELSILDKLTTTLKINPEELVRSLTENFITNKEPVIEEPTKKLKWLNILPDNFDLTPIKRLSLNSEEQEMLRIIAIHSKFNGNPTSDLLETIHDSHKVLTCLNKFEGLNLYSYSSETFSYFQAHGEILSHSFHLTNIGRFIINWIQKNPTKLFCLYDLTLHEFLKLCRLYELNVPSEESIDYLKGLIIKEQELLSTFDKHRYSDKWVKITPTGYLDYITFGYSERDRVKELREELRSTYSMIQATPPDYYQIIEKDFNNPNYLVEKEMRLKELELQKEYPDSFKSEKDFEFLLEEFVIPTKKAHDLIKSLNEE